MNSPCILKVAVNVPLSREFDYLPPERGPVPAPGCRVLVPFGRRRQVGLVLSHAMGSDVSADKMRRVIETLDDVPTPDWLAPIRLFAKLVFDSRAQLAMAGYRGCFSPACPTTCRASRSRATAR